MTVSPRRAAVCLGALSVCLHLTPHTALAQDESSLAHSLDSLLHIPVTTASKYAQMSRDAPASITVVTSDEIRRRGFRTVAQILETVPGFYTTNTRSYVSLGVRGFSPVSGDNNRVLILVDGHALNENFLDGSRIGTALAVDVRTIERVEVVRGPSSALYGSNAMLAVVNLVTKPGRRIDGVRMAIERGGSGLRRGSLLMGRELDSGLELDLSAIWSQSETASYFPEWDAPATNGGVADESDESVGLRGSVSFRDWKLAGFFSDRASDSPLGAFGSDFNSPTARSGDRRFFGELATERELGADKGFGARAYYDGADFHVTYPYAAVGDVRGRTSGRWFGVEGRFRWDPAPSRRLKVGAEYRNNHRARLSGLSPVYLFASGDFPSSLISAFAQADVEPHPDVQITLGGRVDHYSTVGASLSPRGGLVYRPSRGTTLKALYGEAFRAPNRAELDAEARPFVRRNPEIEPERIRTVELVWEQRVTSAAYATLAAYDFRMNGIIGAIQSPDDGSISFENFGEVSSRGFEIGVDASPADGLALRAGYALQLAESHTEEPSRANSPKHSFRGMLSASPVPALDVGLSVRHDAGRAGLPDKASTDGYVITDVTLGVALSDQLRASLAADNLFDVVHEHPAGLEFPQSGHPQDGRMLRFRIDVLF